MSEYLHADLTQQIIKAFYHVYNKLGYGFLEKVYERAMMITLEKYGLQVSQQVPVPVYFEQEQIGRYKADLIVNNSIIVELKSADEIHSKHEAQMLNYLRATDIEIGLLMNFGEQPSFKRKIFTNDRKELPDNLLD